MERSFDVVVVGGGPAGEVAAGRCADGGLKVVLVEEDRVGGECSYWACMPSKALLRPGAALAELARIPGAREALRGGLDVAAALARRDQLTSHWDDGGQVRWLEKAGVELVRGRGRLAGEKTVKVVARDGRESTLRAGRAVILATGSTPANPPIPGLETAAAWSSRDATSARQVPRRLLVLGGGVVGVEMAQAFSRLGAKEVTVLEKEPRLLPREEPFAGEALARAFEQERIAVRTGVEVLGISRISAQGPVTVEVQGEGRVEGDELLAALGRRGATGDLGLETVGLQPDGPLVVDGQLRVLGGRGLEGAAADPGNGWLYAVGDVNGLSLLTHMGKYQARLVADHLLGNPRAERGVGWRESGSAPRVTFTDPEVAAVGLGLQQARDLGLDVRETSWPLGRLAGSSVLGEGVEGMAQLRIDAAWQTVVGATFVGPRAAELLQTATLAVSAGLTLEQLWEAVPAFPTVSEVWLRLLETYGL